MNKNMFAGRTLVLVMAVGLLAALLGGCPQPEPPSVPATDAPTVRPDAGASSGEGEGVGQKVPEFTVTDTAGQPHSPADYRGKILVIDFWATYCKPCIKKLPDYETYYRTYGPNGVAFLGLSMDDSDEVIQGWLKQNDISFPMARVDPPTYKAFFGSASNVPIPQVRVVDAKGIVRYSFTPEATTAQVEEAIKTLLAEKQ